MLSHPIRRAEIIFRFLAAPQPRDIGEAFNLRVGEIPVGAVNLPENMPRIDEQGLLRPWPLRFALIEEPQRSR
jgi:hypothetical protein